MTQHILVLEDDAVFAEVTRLRKPFSAEALLAEVRRAVGPVAPLTRV